MSRSTTMPLLALFASVFLALHLPTTLGWGDVGHSLIGRIAISQLTPTAATLLTTLAPSRATVQNRTDGGPNPNATVAGNISDPGIGSWPDRIRANTSIFYFTNNWHFFNTKDWQCYYDPATDCAAGGCVNTAIQNYTTRVADADKSLNLQEQQYALAFLVHFIEDLHQPLHGGFASDSDGNTIQGAFMTNSSRYGNTNLHAMWDTTIIDTRINRDFYGNPDTYYRYLQYTLGAQYNDSIANWRTCSTASQFSGNYYSCSDDWSQESARLACSSAYTMPDGTRLTPTTTLTPVSSATAGEAYYQQTVPIIELRILQAGVRLANVLNNIAAGNTGGGSGGGGGGDESSDGYSKAAGGFMIFLIVMLILINLIFCGLYYRKEKNGLSGLFASSNSGGGNMGLIGGNSGGGGRTDRMTSSLL